MDDLSDLDALVSTELRRKFTADYLRSSLRHLGEGRIRYDEVRQEFDLAGERVSRKAVLAADACPDEVPRAARALRWLIDYDCPVCGLGPYRGVCRYCSRTGAIHVLRGDARISPTLSPVESIGVQPAQPVALLRNCELCDRREALMLGPPVNDPFGLTLCATCHDQIRPAKRSWIKRCDAVATIIGEHRWTGIVLTFLTAGLILFLVTHPRAAAPPPVHRSLRCYTSPLAVYCGKSP